MLFKDEAAILAARWRALRTESEIEDVAAQTAIALARDHEVPADVLDALNGLMRNYDNRATGIIRVVRYVDSLAMDRDLKVSA
ncbi:MAG: hypothetical protein ACOYON_14045 [Fimbriimonas sp.]